MSLRDDTRETIGALLDGKLTGDAAITKITGFPLEQLTPSQLAGAVDAVMERAEYFPAFPDAVDCCGTGGDGLHTLNISTAVSIVAASCGVQVAKHGNRAVTSKSGSADVLEALGVNTKLAPEQSASILREVGITFLFAPNFHPVFARVAPLRAAIGKRTIFNLLGPLCNPAKVKRQLMGVFLPDQCSLVAEAGQLLGRTRMMVVHGDDGSDELSISGASHVAELENGAIRYAALRPQDAGVTPRALSELKGGNAEENAKAMRELFTGKEGAYADAVALNTAALLVVAGKAGKLYDGVLMAKNAIALGKARRKLEELTEATHA